MELPEPRRGEPVSRVVHVRLAEQLEALAAREPEVRCGDDEGVHKARVAARRLRSALATFRPMLDRDVTEPLREELRWLGRALGEQRDATVVRERLERLLDEQPDDLVEGPVVDRLAAATDDARPPAEVLESPRYQELRAGLYRLVADPPWTEAADKKARKALRSRARKEVRRVRKRYDAAAEAADRDVALHETRKAVKRLRYAAETWAIVGGKDAKRLAKAARHLTSYLGERQDTVATRERLRALEEEARAAGEPTFTYGRLHALEEARAAELDAGLPEAWAEFTELARRSTC